MAPTETAEIAATRSAVNDGPTTVSLAGDSAATSSPATDGSVGNGPGTSGPAAMSEDNTIVDGVRTALPAPQMRVRKRDGSYEPVDPMKIVTRIQRCADGLDGVDPMRVATRTISGLHDGATTVELDDLAIRTAASHIIEEPNYSRLAGRLLATYIHEELRNENIKTFSQSIAIGRLLGLINDTTADFVEANAPLFNQAVDHNRDKLFEFFGLRTVYDRYLLRHPETRKVVETPQYFFMRVACGLATGADDAISFYNLLSSLEYLTSTPTLFNSGTSHPQMSSCYLLDSPLDDLESIYRRYSDVARLSKHAGGIGLSYSRIRSRGSLIKGTNGLSNGIVPWLKTLDSSVQAVNQGGKRKGAACVYVESWHADIYEFLELRDNTGDESRRTHHLNLANWVPDLFMERVEKDWQWSLFDPKRVPHFVDIYGAEFERAYIEAEEAGLYERQVSARDLYSRMMRTLAQTGNGWMTFKDASNNKCNQTGAPPAAGEAPRVVHLSNLCTEIIEVTNQDETAVCNLGSINLSRFVAGDGDSAQGSHFDFDKLGEVVRAAVPFLDRVIDINFYPTDEAGTSNAAWRPVGLGVMGLQDVFFQLRLPFDSPEALELSTRIAEQIYYWALSTSCDLAEKHGPHPSFAFTKAAHGELQYDLWPDGEPAEPERFDALKQRIAEHGLRNSLMIAIAPTATIASISGCFECIEPQISNLFKRETLSGEFIQINSYLVRDLQARGLWTTDMIAEIKAAEGSIQDIDDIPDDTKLLYRTAWELPMRSLIDMAAARGAFIDQSQSLNLFMETPTIGKLSSMYLHAWKAGLKTTYYLRSRAATRINQATSSTNRFSDQDAVACSLENPETCEACD